MSKTEIPSPALLKKSFIEKAVSPIMLMACQNDSCTNISCPSRQDLKSQANVNDEAKVAKVAQSPSVSQNICCHKCDVLICLIAVAILVLILKKAFRLLKSYCRPRSRSRGRCR